LRQETFKQIGEGFSVASSLVQLVAGYVVTYSALLTVSNLHGGPDSPTLAILLYGVLIVVNVALAVCVSFLATGAERDGRWIWALPMSLELLATGAFIKGGVNLLTLVYTGPGEGEAAWGLVLLTYPTWGCCWYSATMWWLRRRRD
jgi:hypothetical protein